MMTFNQKMKCIASDFFIELKIADGNLEGTQLWQAGQLYIHLLILRCKMFVGTPKPVNCIRQMQAEQAQR